MKNITTVVVSIMVLISWNAKAQVTGMAKIIQTMRIEKSPQRNVSVMLHTIKNLQLDTVKNAEDIDVMKGEIALSFLKAADQERFEAYIRLIKNKFNQTSYLNMAADILYKDTSQSNYAAVVAKRTIELYEACKNDPLAKPAGFPQDAWNRFMKMAAFPYYDTYAKILHSRGKDHEALSFEEKAFQNVELETMEQSSVELYTTLLESEQQNEKAYGILLKMARMGKSSAIMDEKLKKLYIKRTGNESGAGAFLDSIQINVAKTYQIELLKKMNSNLNAPDFSLTGLDGKRVSLLDMRGKVVVLDFWATWCVPCLASMPTMKELCRRHPEVVFLFIATAESGTGAAARIKAYVQKTNFPINVLIDKPTATNPKIFPVATAYNLKGIPAKIVIDRNGRLRFLTDGYSSEKELLNEMEAMIALAKTQ